MSSSRPWFFSESLRAKLARDILDALGAGRITAQQSRWLESLFVEPDTATASAAPRVDQLLPGDAVLKNAELADALLISDATATAPDIYLSTALYGLERFDDRRQLIAGLAARFALQASDLSQLEYQRIDGDPFEYLTLAIIDQQIRQLERLAASLERLPALRQAVGQALQQNINAQMPGTPIDVFTHLAQIKTVDNATQAGTPVASVTLVEMAMCAWVSQVLPAGMRYQWLDSDGRELTAAQAGPWQQAVAGVASGLTVAYEGLLKDYWDAPAGGGMTQRDLACQVVTERFRQHLLQSWHESMLDAAEFSALKSLLQPGAAWAGALQVSRLSIQLGSQGPISLAGLFLIAFTSGQLPDLLLYSVEKGLRRFADLDAVAGYFAGIDGRTQLSNHASSSDHPLLRVHGALHVRLEQVATTPFSNLVESLIGLQKRNLAEVLKRTFTSPAQATLTVNEALDISPLIDLRLSVANDAVRWGDALTRSERKWSAFSSPSRIPALRIKDGQDADDMAALPWVLYLNDAWSRVNSLCDVRPSLAGCAQKVLSRYFSVIQDDAVDAGRLWFRDDNDSVVSLSVLLVEQLSGHRTVPMAPDQEVFLDPVDAVDPHSLPWLTPGLLNQVMSRAQQDMVQEYSRQILVFQGEDLRVSESRVIPADASRQLREGLFRLELNMQRNHGSSVGNHGLQMLQQVLDRPLFGLRGVYGLEATEVFVPAVIYDSRQPPAQLTNVLVLQQPLNGDGKPLLWSTVLGLQEFDSISELQLELNTRLAFPGSRERWLQLVALPDREKLRGFLKQGDTQRLVVNLLRVEENIFARLARDELAKQCQSLASVYRTALSWRVDAQLFEHMMTAVALDASARNQIERLSTELEMTLLEGGMPAWLQRASIYDLVLFRQLLVRFRQLYTARQTIPAALHLEEYAAAQLKQRLERDFPDTPLDPDLISITLTRYTVAPGGLGDIPSSIPAATSVISESLTGYAINRFSRFQDASLSVSASDATLLPETLDAAYVRDLVRSLDIGAGYARYLTDLFSETAPDYADRRNQFIAQAPAALLLTALSMKLQGALSPTGYNCVENVLSMPDGIARLPINGQHLEFSPLALVCAPGYAPDLVTGAFLITPTERTQGPWILYVPGDADFLFKEYAGQDELLSDLCTSDKLQARVLERLDPTVRFVYERGGFLQPHLSWATGGFTDLSVAHPGPVQLSIKPLKDNVLHAVFRASLQVLLMRAGKHSVTTAQDDSAGSRFLLLQGVEQLLMFLPGRFGGLVGLWQAQDLLQTSLDSAADDHWARAIAEFAAALALLIASRQQLEEKTPSQPTLSSEPDDQRVLRWHDPQLQVDLNARLQEFEVHDVSLNDLQKDPALNIFTNSISRKQYAAVLGRVYQVKGRSDGWCVIKGGKEGPRIRLDADKHWAVDTELGKRRDGGALTRLRSAQTDINVDDILLVEARGIPEIQRLYPQKAAQIAEAHDQARQYLENALNNLTIDTPQGALDPRTARIITDFFGVASLGNVSVIPIKQVFADIYRLLMDPALSPYSSERYVVGTNKQGYESHTAFTFANDPLQRIFLCEKYFLAPYVRLKSWHMHQGSFNIGAHFRATILIHELSHVADGTHDLAYVESSAPYVDLLEDIGEYRARLKREHQRAQNSFSHRTPRDQLFKVEEDGNWRDLRFGDGDAKSAILRMTGKDSLEGARDSFLHDTRIRSKLILSNADSVALLATLLGRERFLPPAQPAPIPVRETEV